MNMVFAGPAPEALLWRILCVFSLLLFLVSVALTALAVRQKRFRSLWTCIPVIFVSYFIEQCFDSRISGGITGEGTARLIAGIFSLPDIIPLLLCLLLAGVEALMLRSIRSYEKSRITPMSVKEAIDSLPTGVLCYAPKARILLVNRAMRDFCRKATGGELTDGETFAGLLREGALLPGCSRISVGDEPLLVLPDGTAWKLDEGDALYETHPIHMVFASDVTEEYSKTLELQTMQEKVTRLGARLRQSNREIVTLTAEKEILNAKVRIHDEFGSNLLAIKRFLTYGGTEEEKAALAQTLRRNVAFLKNDTQTVRRDEYELLLSMAERLGVSLLVSGELPQSEPNKSIMATAIHECLTNMLRHAHGDRLSVSVSEDGACVSAVFTNNGDAPGENLREKGGLAYLRELTEQAGGTMAIGCQPVFTVTISLPKENEYGI